MQFAINTPSSPNQVLNSGYELKLDNEQGLWVRETINNNKTNDKNLCYKKQKICFALVFSSINFEMGGAHFLFGGGEVKNIEKFRGDATWKIL